jgi:hypothetical protein
MKELKKKVTAGEKENSANGTLLVYEEQDRSICATLMYLGHEGLERE